MNEVSSENFPAEKNTGPTVILSLFLLLLAFFILLNTLATIEESKSKQVLNSVALSFRSPALDTTSVEVFISDLGQSPEPDELLRTVKRLWVTSVPVAKVEVLSPGRVMQMTMPANELFLGGKAELRSDRRRLFQNLAQVLARRGGTFKGEIQAVLGAGETLTGGAPNGTSLQMRRAAVFAEELVAYSAPSDALAVGLREGDPRTLRIRFSVRDAARTRIDFRELVQ
jgi:hypothetical protein